MRKEDRLRALAALGAALLLSGASSLASAANLDVCPSGCAYSSIQAAVLAAGPGDTVRVAADVYRENVVVPPFADVALEGGWDNDFSARSHDPSFTVIDGGGAGSVVSAVAGEGETIKVSLDGLTFTNGRAACGGGLELRATGGGVVSGLVNRLIITGNYAGEGNWEGENGGGVYIEATAAGVAHVVLSNNAIYDNDAYNEGGQIYIGAAHSEVDVSAQNNVIFSREVDTGGIFVYAWNSKVDFSLTNNTIVNLDFYGLEVESVQGVSQDLDVSVSIVNTILWDSKIVINGYGATGMVTARYSNFGYVYNRTNESSSFLDGGGNLNLEPKFFSSRKTDWDFRLLPWSRHVDAGDPASAPPLFPARDIEGTSRPECGRYDMGAYETCALPRPPHTKLTASDGARDDQFGNSVSVSGDTVVVGCERCGGSDAGAAYIFQRAQGVMSYWREVAKLTASDRGTYDYFGDRVAISGDTVVVGATGDDDRGDFSGSAYIFKRDQGGADNWGEVAKLTASDGAASNMFGRSVAIDGDILVVGAANLQLTHRDYYSSAYVFYRNQGGADNWGEVAKLTAPDAPPNDMFGLSVSISADTIIAGASCEDKDPYGPLFAGNSGAAYVFQKDRGGADNWGLVARLAPPERVEGSNFGYGVVVSGDVATAGQNLSTGISSTGRAIMYSRHQGGTDEWGQVKEFAPLDEGGAGRWFGPAASISGDTLAVGDGAFNSYEGMVYIFRNDSGGGNNWGEVMKLTASDASPSDRLGSYVSISGVIVVAGATGDDDIDSDSGAAYIFEIDPPPATYSPGSGILTIPELHLGGAQLKARAVTKAFDIELTRLQERGYVFELTNYGKLTATNNPLATYNPATKVLAIPFLEVLGRSGSFYAKFRKRAGAYIFDLTAGGKN